MIIDAFIFYNEIDLLLYRLTILNPIVDYFILVEATHTFVGKNKTLFYNENKVLFKEFNEKIIHIIVDDFPFKYPNINIANNEQWKNEFFQRNAISRGIDCIPNISNADVIIIADLDEIPDPNTLIMIKNSNIIINDNILQMDLYYYNLNTLFNNYKWNCCKIISYQKYKELNISIHNIRVNTCSSIIENGGWHLSYFGDINFIKNKIENFSHQEYNNVSYNDLNIIKKQVDSFKDLYNRTRYNIIKIDIKDNKYLPPYYDKYLTKYYS
jgi:beta-1,4-mannosyl-glycoprotein beta-1,4-N-acetylglucosaminyltransferase